MLSALVPIDPSEEGPGGGSQDGRRGLRTNTFLMGTLYAAAGSSPVKIRNLSPTGALVEGGVIPPVASKVTLCRGSLEIAGEVVWLENGRAGVRFASLANVADWLPQSSNKLAQQRVDQAVQQVKAGADVAARAHEPPPSPVSMAEIVSARKMIEELAEALAEDQAVLERHGSKLQSLDLAAQVLAKLSARSAR